MASSSGTGYSQQAVPLNPWVSSSISHHNMSNLFPSLSSHPTTIYPYIVVIPAVVQLVGLWASSAHQCCVDTAMGGPLVVYSLPVVVFFSFLKDLPSWVQHTVFPWVFSYNSGYSFHFLNYHSLL